jgi:polar amino acid transport system substrate-binding protein
LGFVFSLSGLAMAGKLQQQLVEQSAVEQIMKRGVLKVGMSTFVPWAMKDKTGKLIGFEIDVATRLAADMGVKIEFTPTKWAGIIPALLTGKFDVIVGGMSIRPDRNLKVNFSIPYDYAGQSLAANKKLAAGFSRLEDFNRSDVVIAARLGSTAADAANRFLPNSQKKILTMKLRSSRKSSMAKHMRPWRQHRCRLFRRSNILNDSLCLLRELLPKSPLDLR